MSIKINRKTFANLEEYAKMGRGCATKIPSPVEIIRVDEEIKKNKQFRRIFSPVNIHVCFIHLTYGSQGIIRREQRERQIDALNAAFQGSGVGFYYNEDQVRYINNYSWYFMGLNSSAEREAKSQLSLNPYYNLNFYTGGLQPGLLGWATYPFDLAGNPTVDGVVVLDESLPLGNQTPFNLGMTGVHEVGHWLGLYHTFEGGCNGIGDYVQDTPAHSGFNEGTPKEGLPHNACKVGEMAPIHNYMNYVNDEWMNNFTNGQKNRIKEHIMMYRPGLLQKNDSLT